ncbi:MAG: hypothetical protein WBH85_15570 [Thermoanaerobaculia bacterium]
MKSRIFTLVLLVFVFGLASGADGQMERIWIVDNASLPGCAEIQGVVIGFLIPEQGVLLLSTQQVPGTTKIGELRDEVLSFSQPPLGRFDLNTHQAPDTPTTIWGTLDQVIPVGNQTGCIAFDRALFSDIDDFRTYVMWILDRYAEFTPADVTGGWAMRISDRIVTLDITPDGYGSAQIRVKEGGLTELRLSGQESMFAFLPVILDEQTGRVAVRVVSVEKSEEGKKTYSDLGIVETSYDAPAVAPTQPLLEVRIVTIQ